MGNQQIDAVFDALADGERRHVCRYLEDCGDPVVTLADLTTYVARETLSGPEMPTTPGTDQRESIRVTLHHVHLPKLDAADVVEYDAQRNLVVPDTFLPMAAGFARRSEVIGSGAVDGTFS